MKAEILYCYVNKKNKSYVQELSEKHKQPVSRIVDAMIDAIKENRKFAISKPIPLFVKKAEEWKRAHGM